MPNGSLAHLADENVDGLNGVASVGRRLAGIALAALRVGTPGLDGWRRPEHRRVAQCHFEICDPLGQAVTEEFLGFAETVAHRVLVHEQPLGGGFHIEPALDVGEDRLPDHLGVLVRAAERSQFAFDHASAQVIAACRETEKLDIVVQHQVEAKVRRHSEGLCGPRFLVAVPETAHPFSGNADGQLGVDLL